MRLSVIVCTRNRAHAIIPCLDSIAASLAHAAPVDAEIVVVDNASTDDTSSLLREWARTCAFPVNAIYEARPGLSGARNSGIRAAKGDYLVWTDDDCRLATDHISTALRYDAADTELILRGGRVERGDPGDLLLSVKTDQSPESYHIKRAPQKDTTKLSNTFIGANMLMRRALVDKIGFFDERFGSGSRLPGGEEVDYIYRAYIAGLIIEYAPDIVVFHHHGRKAVSVGNNLMRNYSIAAGGLYAKYIFKHPHFCRPLYWTLKNGVLETLLRWEYHKDKVGPRAKTIFYYNTLGIVKYCIASAKELPRSRRVR